MSTTHSARALVVTVRLMEGRYHGEPEWPPAPARLFQALVAGGSHSGGMDSDRAAALRWLESLPAPAIAVPMAQVGQVMGFYVPNNDLDSKGGDPQRIPEIRKSKKMFRPRIFDCETPLIYAWPLPEPAEEAHGARICDLALDLYQLGRGVDMAWATAEILDERALAELLGRHPGRIFRPTPGPTRGADALPCPQPGTLDSLDARHAATLNRFTFQGKGRNRIQVFQQPPKPRFAQVAFDSPPPHALFDLRPPRDMAAFAATPLSHIVRLTEALRDAAASRLAEVFPARHSDIERALIGRRVEGLPAVPPDARIRLVALPSIGHEHADRGIRRLLVEVPAGGPLHADDVFWAFSGLTLLHTTGAELELTLAEDESMLGHYGVDSGGRTLGGHWTWRTVTPAALPAPTARRRIEPTCKSAEAKDALERSREEALATGAVVLALRHAGVRSSVEQVRVQREPFEAKGARAEAFAPGTRFAKERLWHVELTFRDPIAGPLLLGDGRFLGLGLMAPTMRETAGVLAFRIVSGLVEGGPPQVVAVALRRAVMARFQAIIGEKELPPFVSGHDAGGRLLDEPHLVFVFDPEGPRLLVVSPHTRDHRGPWRQEGRHLRTLERALMGFADLRAGPAGHLSIEPGALLLHEDPLFAPSRCWVSRTPYVVNRHLKHASAAETLIADLEASCRKLGLPTPRVAVLEARGVPGAGLTGRAELRFDVAVPGPLLLGRTRHKGGGLFGHLPTSSSVEQ